MTVRHNAIAKYAMRLTCGHGDPSIAIYRQKLKNVQTHGRMLMFILNVGLYNVNLVKCAVKQKLKSTMTITTNRLKLHGCAVSVI